MWEEEKYMIDLYFGIDCSMRSTGCCCLDSNGKIIDMLLIRPPKELTRGEDIIEYHDSFIKRWMDVIYENHYYDLIDEWHSSESDTELYDYLSMSKEEYIKIIIRCDFDAMFHSITPHFMIEKIAIGGQNASKEIIAGVNWHIRWKLYQMYDVIVDEVVVNSWRAGVITKDIRKELKARGVELKKEQIKIETYNLLTPAAKECIDGYVTRENLWSAKAHYDLTDAYFISEYCRNKHI